MTIPKVVGNHCTEMPVYSIKVTVIRYVSRDRNRNVDAICLES